MLLSNRLVVVQWLHSSSCGLERRSRVPPRLCDVVADVFPASLRELQRLVWWQVVWKPKFCRTLLFWPLFRAFLFFFAPTHPPTHGCRVYLQSCTSRTLSLCSHGRAIEAIEEQCSAVQGGANQNTPTPLVLPHLSPSPVGDCYGSLCCCVGDCVVRHCCLYLLYSWHSGTCQTAYPEGQTTTQECCPKHSSGKW